MPKYKFTMIGKGKVVHAVRTKASDLKEGSTGSQCPTVRKAWVADNIKGKGISPEAALEIDDCSRCGTHAVASALIKGNETPEQRKAKAADKRDEVIERAKPKPTKAEAKKRAAKIGKGPRDKADKPAKEKKSKAGSMTKSGKRSTGSTSKDKADELAAFAKESGWKPTVVDDGQHVRCTAVRGDETINVWYIDGKYDPARPAEVVVGSWSGKLRGAHSARRQMAGEGRDRPHPEPGKGRSGPRKSKVEDDVPADESPEDAAKRLPFLHDDEAPAIIESILGKTIRWRNTVTKSIEEARVPSNVRSRAKAKNDAVKIQDHPTKSNRRILSFLEVIGSDDDGREMFGPERNVALSNIVRVVA